MSLSLHVDRENAYSCGQVLRKVWIEGGQISMRVKERNPSPGIKKITRREGVCSKVVRGDSGANKSKDFSGGFNFSSKLVKVTIEEMKQKPKKTRNWKGRRATERAKKSAAEASNLPCSPENPLPGGVTKSTDPEDSFADFLAALDTVPGIEEYFQWALPHSPTGHSDGDCDCGAPRAAKCSESWDWSEKLKAAELVETERKLFSRGIKPRSQAMTPPNSTFEESIMLRGPLTLTSTTEAVSPVTLSSDWSRVARLLLLTALSVTGSVGNVFMISAVMIEDHLKKRGNSFLVNIALADILITGLVIPSSTVVILADLTDAKIVVCNFQWFLALVSCLVSVLTISATAMENYARLCMSPDCYSTLTPCKITVIIILIWLTSCTAVTVQTVLRLGPDYCERTSQGLLPYQITIGVLLVLLPAAVACACFSLITLRVRTFKSIPTFRPPVTFTFDYELMKTNMYGFIFFFLFWLPFGTTLALGSVQTISQRVFYSLAWLALSKSCFLNFLYCITNRHFRNAYVNLFHYCCCKTTVSFSRRSRDPVRPTGDVRVHIIPGYNMYSYTSPQRSREVAKVTSKRVGTTASCRPVSGRPNGRDVYEL